MNTTLTAAKQPYNNRSTGAVILSFNISLGSISGFVKNLFPKYFLNNNNRHFTVTDIKALRTYINTRNKKHAANIMNVSRRTIQRSIRKCEKIIGTKDISEMEVYLNNFLSL